VMMIPIPQAGILRQVKGQAEASQVPAIEDIKLTIPIGQEIVPLPEGSRYLGFIFARDRTPAGVESALREAHRRLSFVITPAEEPAGQVKPPALAASRADTLPLSGH
jgi:L-amino acid ligase C-terminal domain 2